MSQFSEADVTPLRTEQSGIRNNAIHETTAVESQPRRLETLLDLIAADKDQMAFAELYSATRRKLFSTVLLIVGRPAIAEEVLQEAFVRIWRNANAYRSSRASAMTWMIAITRNIAIDHVRRPVREAHTDDNFLLALRSDDPTALEAIEAQEDQQMMICQQHMALSALQALDPARRDLVIAAYIYGESRQHLAKARGVPVSTVKTWIRRALLEIEAAVAKAEPQRAPATRTAATTTNARPPAEFIYAPRAAGSGRESRSSGRELAQDQRTNIVG
jgi:RNA polymerase sigma-70 factor (ECF subfamily)